MFDAPVKQYILFADFEQDVKDRKVPDMPEAFHDENGKLNKHAQAYYGLFQHLFGKDYFSDKGISDEQLTQYAFSIDEVVNNAVAEYSINPSEIDNAISMKLLPMLFADLGVQDAQSYIEEVLKITRLGISRS